MLMSKESPATKNAYHNQALAHCKQLLSPQHRTGNLDPLRRLNTETMPITNPLGLPDAHQLCHREATRPWDGTKYLIPNPPVVPPICSMYGYGIVTITVTLINLRFFAGKYMLYNRHIMGLVRIMVRIKRNPFSSIGDSEIFASWIHSPSRCGPLFSDDGVGFVEKLSKKSYVWRGVFLLVCLGKVTRESLETSSVVVVFHGIQTPQCLES